MNKIKRSLSLIMAMVMITLVLPIGEIVVYGEEIGDYKIEKIQFEIIFEEDSGFDKKNAIINIIINGENLEKIEDIKMIFENKEEENIEKDKINLVSESIIEITDLSGELLDGEIKIGEEKFSLFEMRPEITGIYPENGIIDDRLEISGNNLGKIENDNITASFTNAERSKEVEEYIEGEKIITDVFKYEKGNWDFKIIKESGDGEELITTSEIIYKDLVKANKDQGMKIEHLDPREGSIEGLDINIYGKNIFKSQEKSESKIGIDEATNILNIEKTNGIYNNKKYSELKKEVEVLLDGIVLEIKDYGEDEERITVEIPRYEIGENITLEDLEKNLAIHIKTTVRPKLGETKVFYEKDLIKKAFTYIIDPDKRPIIDDISSRTIKKADGAKELKIRGENFPVKDEIKIKLGEKLIDKKNYTINDKGTEITINLPQMDSIGLYDLKIFNSEGGIGRIVVEYVDDFTEYEDIESIEIFKKSSSFIENRFLISDFAKEARNTEFKLNLKDSKKIDLDLFDRILGIKLVRESDGKSVEVKKDNNTFRIIGEEVIISLSDSAREALSYGTKFDKCENRETAAGKYRIYIDIKDEDSKLLKIKTKEIDDEEYETWDYLSIKDKPWVRNTYPIENSSYFNPEYLYESFTEKDGKVENGHYIRATFDNLGGTLDFIQDPDGRNPSGIRVGFVGDTVNQVDLEKKLQLRDSTLYIPLKDKLEDGKEYEVYIEEGRYLEYKDYRFNFGEESKNYRNKCYSWRFGTKPMPVSEMLFEGSVIENYDTKYPIVIDGSDFIPGVEVYFEDNRGDRYWADRVERRRLDDNKSRLYIYLPRGRDKLYPGEYKIVIRNGWDHKLEMDYGRFSVIKEGDQVPNEDSFLRKDKYYGHVYALRGQSSDRLEVRSSDRDRNYLKIDLDDIMGEDTWSRSLEYPVSYGDRIGTLELGSKWANLEIKNLRLSYDYNERFIKLQVGRAAPALLGSLKSKLMNVNIKSDFIEVGGENNLFDTVGVEIPYRESEGQNLKLLRYDEGSRSFYTIPSVTNHIDRTVRGISKNPGIFVVVE